VPREICGTGAASYAARRAPVPRAPDPSASGLTDLVLRSNYLSGRLDLAACESIINLDLRGNAFTGPVPGHAAWRQVHLMRVTDNGFDSVRPGFFAMSSLTYFDGAGNALRGRLPERVADLEQLTNLYLMDNDLLGPLPAGLFEARRLSFLFLDGNPSLGGPIPEAVGRARALSMFSASLTQITGAVPRSMGGLRALTHVNLVGTRMYGCADRSAVNRSSGGGGGSVPSWESEGAPAGAVPLRGSAEGISAGGDEAGAPESALNACLPPFLELDPKQMVPPLMYGYVPHSTQQGTDSALARLQQAPSPEAVGSAARSAAAAEAAGDGDGVGGNARDQLEESEDWGRVGVAGVISAGDAETAASLAEEGAQREVAGGGDGGNLDNADDRHDGTASSVATRIRAVNDSQITCPTVRRRPSTWPPPAPARLLSPETEAARASAATADGDRPPKQRWFLPSAYAGFSGCVCDAGFRASYERDWAGRALLVCEPDTSWGVTIAVALSAACAFVLCTGLVLSLGCARTSRMAALARSFSRARRRARGAPTKGSASLVFTDIEGYTAVMKAMPREGASALRLHMDVLRRARFDNCGHTAEQEGDSFALVFSHAIDAVSFCLQAQQALLEAPWPPALRGAMADALLGLGGGAGGAGSTVGASVGGGLNRAASASTGGGRRQSSDYGDSGRGRTLAALALATLPEPEALVAGLPPLASPPQDAAKTAAALDANGRLLSSSPPPDRGLARYLPRLGGGSGGGSVAAGSPATPRAGAPSRVLSTLLWTRWPRTVPPAGVGRAISPSASSFFRADLLPSSGGGGGPAQLPNAAAPGNGDNAAAIAAAANKAAAAQVLGAPPAPLVGPDAELGGPEAEAARRLLFSGLRVRMGVATGYLAPGVALKRSQLWERAKIVSDAANGGQVLVDASTFEAVRDRLEELGAVGSGGYNPSAAREAARRARRAAMAAAAEAAAGPASAFGGGVGADDCGGGGGTSRPGSASRGQADSNGGGGATTPTAQRSWWSGIFPPPLSRRGSLTNEPSVGGANNNNNKDCGVSGVAVGRDIESAGGGKEDGGGGAAAARAGGAAAAAPSGRRPWWSFGRRGQQGAPASLPPADSKLQGQQARGGGDGRASRTTAPRRTRRRFKWHDHHTQADADRAAAAERSGHDEAVVLFMGEYAAVDLEGAAEAVAYLDEDADGEAQGEAVAEAGRQRRREAQEAAVETAGPQQPQAGGAAAAAGDGKEAHAALAASSSPPGGGSRPSRVRWATPAHHPTPAGGDDLAHDAKHDTDDNKEGGAAAAPPAPPAPRFSAGGGALAAAAAAAHPHSAVVGRSLSMVAAAPPMPVECDDGRASRGAPSGAHRRSSIDGAVLGAAALAARQPSTATRLAAARSRVEALVARGGPHGAPRLRLYQVLAPSLVGRAKVFGNRLALGPGFVCVDAPYFDAPAAWRAPLCTILLDGPVGAAMLASDPSALPQGAGAGAGAGSGAGAASAGGAAAAEAARMAAAAAVVGAATEAALAEARVQGAEDVGRELAGRRGGGAGGGGAGGPAAAAGRRKSVLERGRERDADRMGTVPAAAAAAAAAGSFMYAGGAAWQHQQQLLLMRQTGGGRRLSDAASTGGVNGEGSERSMGTWASPPGRAPPPPARLPSGTGSGGGGGGGFGSAFLPLAAVPVGGGGVGGGMALSILSSGSAGGGMSGVGPAAAAAAARARAVAERAPIRLTAADAGAAFACCISPLVSLPLPPVAMVFVAVDGAATLLAASPRVARCAHAQLVAAVREALYALRPLGGAYLVRDMDAELKLLLAFGCPAAAVEWCLALQEAAMHVPWPDALVGAPVARSAVAAAAGGDGSGAAAAPATATAPGGSSGGGGGGGGGGGSGAAAAGAADTPKQQQEQQPQQPLVLCGDGHPRFREERDAATGELLFRGPRLRMAVCEGRPRAVMPDFLGRADYFGNVVNLAARFMDASAHGGQVVVTQALARRVADWWRTHGSAAECAQAQVQAARERARGQRREQREQEAQQQQQQQQEAPYVLSPRSSAAAMMAAAGGPVVTRNDTTPRPQHPPPRDVVDDEQPSSPTGEEAERMMVGDDGGGGGGAGEAAAAAPACAAMASPSLATLPALSPRSGAGGAGGHGLRVLGSYANTNAGTPQTLLAVAAAASAAAGAGAAADPATSAAAVAASAAASAAIVAASRAVEVPPPPSTMGLALRRVRLLDAGVYRFRGAPEPLPMAHVALASLAARRFPVQPPRGKGVRIAPPQRGLLHEAELMLLDAAGEQQRRYPSARLDSWAASTFAGSSSAATVAAAAPPAAAGATDADGAGALAASAPKT